MSRLLVEFDSPQALLAAVHQSRAAGLSVVDAFTPFPLSELPAALGIEDHRMERLGFAGLIFGGLFGWAIQWLANVSYPLDIGGRPGLAPPSFTVLTFEFAVFGAVLCMVGGFFRLCRLPKLHQPLFAVAQFARASDDRFFLLIEAADKAAVAVLAPLSVSEVEL
jgi:hypothetical protein